RQAGREWTRHAYWMFSVILGDEVEMSRDDLMERLYGHGIETRPIFYPVHLLPPYRDAARGEDFPVAEELARRGLSLPTWAGLSLDDLDYVCQRLRECLPGAGEVVRG
ncbi:MAG: DegT/DnrJ/EryC1/StrS family aminotransferase, partial [Pyrinomonadaceae bacterium]